LQFLDDLLALFLGYLFIGLLLLLLKRRFINSLIDKIIKRIMVDPYPENLIEMYNVFSKVGLENVLETDIRGTSGEPLKRPFGSPRQMSPWDKLLFNPVYLTREPLSAQEIETKVIIGQQAKKPLMIDLPIMIGGMAYGIGISKKTRLALAEATAKLNTATNTGVGPLLPEERRVAKNLIIQYHRGSWGNEEETLKNGDMVEIQLGYGALGSAPVRLLPEEISPDFRAYLGLKKDEGLSFEAQIPGVENGTDLANLVRRLKQLTGGVPIGIKIGATHLLEKELEIMIRANPDFISIDGAEGGINFGPGILADDLGLPCLPALCRAVEFLKKKGVKDQISLIISGGLFTPGHFLKALALGADAVAIGTVALLALAHTQLTKVVPWEPPTNLIYEIGPAKDKLAPEVGAKSVMNYLLSCHQEMKLAMSSLGRRSLKELSPTDLCALTPEVAEMTGVEIGLYSPARRSSV
jgi:glutamate synthase domain-containing protein 2